MFNVGNVSWLIWCCPLQPNSPAQIVVSIDAEHRPDLESQINELEDENRWVIWKDPFKFQF